MQYKYRVHTPGEGVHSWHWTQSGAERSLNKRFRGMKRQCKDALCLMRVEWFDGCRWINVTDDDYSTYDGLAVEAERGCRE